MAKENPNIKRKKDSQKGQRFKVDETQSSSKFKGGKSEGRFVKKPLEEEDENCSDNEKKRGAYVKQDEKENS